MKSLKQIICTIYLAVLLIVYPLYTHNGYYDIGMAKYKFYLISTLIFLGLIVIAIITDPDTYAKSGSNSGSKKKNKNSKQKKVSSAEKLSFKERLVQIKNKFMAWFGPKSMTEKFVWAYLVCVFISFFVGIDKYTGFWGADGWQMGLLMQCIMIASFFVFAKVWTPDKWPIVFLMIGTTIVYVIGLLQRFSIDPLGFYDGLEEYLYVISYVTTIGQCTWYSGFIAVLFPIVVVLFFCTDTKWIKIMTGINCLIGFMAVALNGSDSIFVAIFGMLLVLFWMGFDDYKYMKSFLEVIGIMALAFSACGFLQRRYMGIGTVVLDPLPMFMSTSILMIVVLGVVFVIYCIWNTKYISKSLIQLYNNGSIIRYMRLFIYVIMTCLFVSGIVVVTFNTNGLISISSNNHIISSLLIFDDSWGGHRGFNWKLALHMFADLDILHKLLGVGPDSFGVVVNSVQEYYDMVMKEYINEGILVCAHNIVLNQLICYGILGVISYVGIFLSTMVRCIKNYKRVFILAIGAACIACYGVNNMFCYQTVLCTPYIFIIIGICENLNMN